MLASLRDVDMTPAPIVMQVARLNHFVCKRLLFFPEWVLDGDYVLHHDPKVEQTDFKRLTCTLAIHFTASFVLTTIADYGFVRPLCALLRRRLPPVYDRKGGVIPQEKRAAAGMEGQWAEFHPFPMLGWLRKRFPVVDKLVTKIGDAVSGSAKDKTLSGVEPEEDPASPVLVSPQQVTTQLAHKVFDKKDGSAEEKLLREHEAARRRGDPRGTTWILLHVIFNAVIAAISIKESWHAFMHMGDQYPKDPSNGNRRWHGNAPGGLLGAAMIGGFHFQHSVLYMDLLTRADVVHHFLSAGAVVAVGIYCPFGAQGTETLSNLFMCGIPGGVSYFYMFLNQMGYATREKYMKMNRYMNLLLRLPGQLMSHYIGQRTHFSGEYPESIGPVMRAVMWLGGSAHTINALYFCDLVIQTYGKDMAKIAAEKKEKKDA